MSKVELHAHSYASYDLNLRPLDIVRLCKKKGIDKLAITDHHSIRGALEIQTFAPELIIIGEEIMTTQGELLAYFVKEEVPRGLSPIEVIDNLKAQGAIISVPHPFDRWRTGAWQEVNLLALLPFIDAIEVFNSRCVFKKDNERALAFAQKFGLLSTVGSDAHNSKEFGHAVLIMKNTPNNAEEFLSGLSQGEALCQSTLLASQVSSMIKWTFKEIFHSTKKK